MWRFPNPKIYAADFTTQKREETGSPQQIRPHTTTHFLLDRVSTQFLYNYSPVLFLAAPFLFQAKYH